MRTHDELARDISFLLGARLLYICAIDICDDAGTAKLRHATAHQCHADQPDEPRQSNNRREREPGYVSRPYIRNE